MICRKCNKEFDEKTGVCPHCGERYEDDYFSKMLEYAMSDNTRSAEEINKLRKDIYKKKMHRKRNIIIATVITVLVLSAAVCGAYFLISRSRTGNRVFRAGFNGSAFSVYDENGNEIRTVSGGKYTKSEYSPDGSKASSVSYCGFVSFEKFDYKDGLLNSEYAFDGVKNYTYKDYNYEFDGENPVRSVYESNALNGMIENEYDDDGNIISVSKYDFESEEKHEFVYDSVGRLTSEKSYDIKGQTVYNKQYSYKSDGTVYLSSTNEVYKTDESGNAKLYILTMFGEDGNIESATVNTPEGHEVSKVEYKFNDKGDPVMEKTTEGVRWFTYEYYDNGVMSLKAEAPSEDSKDYTRYITYDKQGRELKNITATTHYEYMYDENGNVIRKSLYSPSASYLGRTDYLYENGGIKSETEYDANDAVVGVTEYSCDENGNPVTKSGADGTYSFINSYNEQGDLTGVKKYKMYSRERFEYNKNGKVTKKTAFNENSAFVSEVGYKYAGDKVSDEYTYDSEGNTLSHIKYHYDDEGSQTGLTTYNSDGKITCEAQLSYDDRKKEIILENKDDNGNLLYYVKYNYSNDKPSLKISGTVSGSEYENVYSYNDMGELSGVTYSRDGKLVSEEKYTYNETGNIIEGMSERGDAGKSVYKYKYDGPYLESCDVTYPDGLESSITYGIDESKKPYVVSGENK